MASTAQQTIVMVKGDKDYIIASFDDALEKGITITGTPTIAEQDTAVLTFGTATYNTGTAISNATYRKQNRIITKVDGFSAYEYSESDSFTVSSGTGATTGTYIVTDKLNDHQIVLESNIGDGADGQTNITGTLNNSTNVLGSLVRPGRAVIVFVNTDSATAGTTYTVKITATTTANSSTGIKIRFFRIHILAAEGE